jgi:hypothetical protein
MKLIKNYRGENLNEKVYDLRFFYKNSMVQFIDENGNLNNMICSFEQVQVEIIKNDTEFLLEQLECLNENFQNGFQFSELEKNVFAMNVYWLTKIGIIENNEFNGMMILTEL